MQRVPLHQMLGLQLGRARDIHERQVGVHADGDTALAWNPKSSGGLGRDER
jgi:hypothetical protein